MFDIGFWELLVIAIVALAVIGPKRLPEIAQLLGRQLRQLQHIWTQLSNALISSETQQTTTTEQEKVTRQNTGDL